MTMAASQSQLMAAANLKIHVFVNHDPFMASVFLPDLFANFLDSAWQLPPTNPALANESRRYISYRDELGRHVLAPSVPGLTTLDEVAGMIEQQLGIERNQHAHFTVFPQDYNYDTRSRPAWHDRPLAGLMTVAEAQLLDEDAALLQASGPLMLHLVFETKAAALNRIVGSAFLSEELGMGYRFCRDVQSVLNSFTYAYHKPESEYPNLVKALLKWRHATHALSYLYGEQRRGTRLEGQIEKLETDKAEAKAAISTLVRQWASWLVKPDNWANVPGVAGNLDDDAVEATVQWVWDTKHKLVNEWKTSERKQAMHDALERRHLGRYPPGQSRIIGSAWNPTPIPQPDNPSIEPIPDEPPSECSVRTHTIRNPDNTLSSTHSSFTVTSGVFLWGHILPMHHGAQTTTLTNNASSIPPLLPGGTIMQRVYTYRSAARQGEWKVRRYLSNWRAIQGGRDIPPTSQAGWVFCHADVDAMDVIRRVRAINPYGSGISNGNGHVDKGVVYIGRYDWGSAWHSPEDPEFVDKFQAWAEPAVGRVVPRDGWDDRKCNVHVGGYFMAVDAEEWGLDLLRAYKRECEDDPEIMVERVFEKGSRGRFGAYVRMPDTEYEFGWLVFSGEKHTQHEGDELIAIVYDAAYEVLEGVYHAVEPEP